MWTCSRSTVTRSRERLPPLAHHIHRIYIQRASHCYNHCHSDVLLWCRFPRLFETEPRNEGPVIADLYHRGRVEEHREHHQRAQSSTCEPQIYLCVSGLPRKTTIRNSRGQVRKTLSTGLRHRAFTSSNPPKPENLVGISRKQSRPCIGPRGGGFCVPGRTSFAEQRTISNLRCTLRNRSHVALSGPA